MDQLPALEPDEPEPEVPEINTIVEAESDTEADDIFVKPIALEIKEVKMCFVNKLIIKYFT